MNSGNVSAAKPKIEGAAFAAKITSTLVLPTSVSATLATDFKELGYMSQDGIRNNHSPESEEVKAWGGDVVLTPMTGRPDTWQLKLIECTNIETLKLVYGDGNVTGSFSAGIEVEANAKDLDPHAWVFDMAIKGGLKRIVLPKAKITALAEITYKDNDAIGYDITLKCEPDGDGNTHYEYMKANSTTTGGGSGSGTP